MMVRARSFAVLAVVAALPLVACSVAEDNPANQTMAGETAGTGGVTREEIKAEEPPVQPMPPMAVIQSQPGPDGSQVDLVKVAVTGDILTVTMRCSSEDTVNSESFRVADISIIDDATSQRIGVLKDDQGKPMVSDPSPPKGDYMGADCEKKPGVIWAKFPAPPATSKTVSINFPEVAPFDGVTVTR
jgi:hypothetical protein